MFLRSLNNFSILLNALKPAGIPVILSANLKNNSLPTAVFVFTSKSSRLADLNPSHLSAKKFLAFDGSDAFALSNLACNSFLKSESISLAKSASTLPALNSFWL